MQETKSKEETPKGNISSFNDQKVSETKIAGIIPLWQLWEKIPLFILSVIFSMITIYAQYKPSLEYLPLGSRLTNDPVSFMTYLEKIFWPHDMAVFYPFSDQLPFLQVLGSALLIVIISVAVIVEIKHLPYLVAGWFWYVITLLPVTGIIQARNFSMADRYTYLPLIGIAVMLAWGIPSLIKAEYTRKKILFPLAIAFLAILAVLTWRQCSYWKNSIEICNHALQVTKDNYLAHIDLGSALFDEGKIEEAIAHYNETISIMPNITLSYNKRGIAYAKLGQYQRAIEDFNQAIRIKPEDAISYNCRGNAYAERGQYQMAIEDYSKSIYLNSDDPFVYYKRGIAYTKLGQYQMAIEDFSIAIHLKPDYADAYNNRGAIYSKFGQYQMAIEDFNTAIRLKPDDADTYFNRGLVYFNQGNNISGCEDAKKACELGNCKILEAVTGKGFCRR